MELSENEKLIERLMQFFRNALVSEHHISEEALKEQGTGYFGVRTHQLIKDTYKKTTRYFYSLNNQSDYWTIEWVQDQPSDEDMPNKALSDVWVCMTFAREQENCAHIYKIVQELRSVAEDNIQTWDQELVTDFVAQAYKNLTKIQGVEIPRYREVVETLRSVVTPFDKYADTANKVIFGETSRVQSKLRFFPEKSNQYIQLPEKTIQLRGSNLEYKFEIYIEPAKQVTHSLFYMAQMDSSGAWSKEIEGSQHIGTVQQNTAQPIDINFILEKFKDRVAFNELCP